MLSEDLNPAAGMVGRPYDEIPPTIRAELNAEIDREMIHRMQDLARRKRMRRPDINDDEMADYLALAENRKNAVQWIRARRIAIHGPERATSQWMVAIGIIVGILAVMLITGIAVSV